MQIVVGTATTMAWSSSDEGKSWSRMAKGIHYPATPAWALSSHPARLGELLANTDNGIMRWCSAAEGWIPLFNEFSGTSVWALGHAPSDPDFILAGLALPETQFGGVKDSGYGSEGTPAHDQHLPRGRRARQWSGVSVLEEAI